MRRRTWIVWAAAAVIAGQSCIPAVSAAIGDRAGVAAAVRGAVKLISPGNPGRSQDSKIGRVVSSGDAIHLGDRITTGAKSGLQIMLLDQTVFTIGPNASMVIDKFVYDPAKASGTLRARILKGTFRFVSGKIARTRPDAVKIKLKVATLAIRGTNVVGQTGGAADVVLLSGTGSQNNGGTPTSAVRITANGVTVTITESGFGAVVFDNGSGPQTQYFNAAAFAQILGALGLKPPPPPKAGAADTAESVPIDLDIVITFTGQGTGAGQVNIQIGNQVFTFTTSQQPPTVLPPFIPPPSPAVTPSGDDPHGEGDDEDEYDCEVC